MDINERIVGDGLQKVQKIRLRGPKAEQNDHNLCIQVRGHNMPTLAAFMQGLEGDEQKNATHSYFAQGRSWDGSAA
jgi:hypothetical protein